MSNAALRRTPDLDVDGFLAFLDERPGERWELDDGVPRAMVGGTFAHAAIGSNIVAALKEPARRRGCHAIGGFLAAIGDRSAYEPDALILCGPVDRTSRRTHEPVVVFEVMSPSTMDYDRSVKARRYRAITDRLRLPGQRSRRSVAAPGRGLGRRRPTSFSSDTGASRCPASRRPSRSPTSTPT